jgi:hypothetical protein
MLSACKKRSLGETAEFHAAPVSAQCLHIEPGLDNMTGIEKGVAFGAALDAP